MGLKLSNNAISRLAADISNAATTITLEAGTGALFPSIGAGEWFPATIFANPGLEIVRVTARSGDTLTVERGQEGTAAQAFTSGAFIEVRLTVAALSEMILPPGTGPLPWSLTTEPTGWIFCDGRTLLSTTPYGALRAAYIAASFPFGQDGSGNPKIPDMRGRAPFGLDNMGGSAASRITAGGSGIAGTTIGASGGAETHILTATQMPTHAHGVTDPGHAHSVYDPSHTHSQSGAGSDGLMGRVTSGGSYTISGGGPANGWTFVGLDYAYTGIGIYNAYTGLSIQDAGGGGAHNNMPPALMTNYILKT